MKTYKLYDYVAAFAVIALISGIAYNAFVFNLI
jgi:hypothetical protein